MMILKTTRSLKGVVRFTWVTFVLLGVATAGHAQVIIGNDFDTPDGFITILNSAADAQAPPIGNCAILFPADQGSGFGDCQVTGAPPDTIFIWVGPPADGGTPALTLPYGDGTIQISNPSAHFYNELDNGNVWIQTGRLGTIVGQGQVRRPSGLSFSRTNLSGDQRVPPNPTMATGTCDVLLIADDFISQVPLFYDCSHDVPNATFGQFRNGSPGGNILLDFGNQLGAERQQGVLRVDQTIFNDFLNGNIYAVIDESFAGARIAGQVGTCWNGRDADNKSSICLQEQRFKTTVDYLNAELDSGSAVPVFPGPNDETGLFYFQDTNNFELLLKVFDGCSINEHFWVFFAATTNVEFTVTVTDTQTGTTKQYFNPPGTLRQPIQDRSAFATCPASSPSPRPTLTLTPAGITPSGLQISLGQRVLIVNQSGVNRMIQSNPHPFHTQCPALNAAGLLGPGESGLTGTFDIERTCGFHDHLNPIDSTVRGQITVGSGQK